MSPIQLLSVGSMAANVVLLLWIAWERKDRIRAERSDAAADKLANDLRGELQKNGKAYDSEIKRLRRIIVTYQDKIKKLRLKDNTPSGVRESFNELLAEASSSRDDSH